MMEFSYRVFETSGSVYKWRIDKSKFNQIKRGFSHDQIAQSLEYPGVVYMQNANYEKQYFAKTLAPDSSARIIIVACSEGADENYSSYTFNHTFWYK